jgi:outer membrane protein TolC
MSRIVRSPGAFRVEPIFDGGTLWHRQRAVEAQFDVSAAQYRSTMIATFLNELRYAE